MPTFEWQSGIGECLGNLAPSEVRQQWWPGLVIISSSLGNVVSPPPETPLTLRFKETARHFQRVGEALRKLAALPEATHVPEVTYDCHYS
jgi:hypothetical protein